MSAVSAGISEVLIKYTGTVWLQTNFYNLLKKKERKKKNCQHSHIKKKNKKNNESPKLTTVKTQNYQQYD